MKTVRLLFVFLIIGSAALAQSKEKVLEQRAKDLHAALVSPDKEVWKKFITENYTPGLIERRGFEKMLSNWANIHAEFGDSKIVSLKMKGDKYEMIAKRNDDGHEVQYLMTPEKDKPYRIDGMQVEVGNIQKGPGDGSGDGEVVIKN